MHQKPHFNSTVLASREKLKAGREKMRALHDSGAKGIQVCAGLADVLDTVVLDIYHAALRDLGEKTAQFLETQIALVPHGGYGRRDVAPYSDLDLMLLFEKGLEPEITPFVQRLTKDLVDVGVKLGFNPRTPQEACDLSMEDMKILTSLVESRYLGGSVRLYTGYMERLRRYCRNRYRKLIPAIQLIRREERLKYGETVYLLEPNVKASRGALREIQSARWFAFVRYGETEPDSLRRMGVLSREDRDLLRDSRDFLLRLRNEMHFHAGKAQDDLRRPEQLRLAEWYGYEGSDGLMPVERFMKDYFDMSGQVRYTVAHFRDNAQYRTNWTRLLVYLFTREIEQDFRIGPWQIGVKASSLDKIKGDLSQVLRLMELANVTEKRIDHPTFSAIRKSMLASPPTELAADTSERFLALISEPGRLGALLRRLHQMRVLEKIIPAFAHARGLMQFNEYHKYTVDEHTLRALENAISYQTDDGPLGDAYRKIRQKRTLHLAILLHDVGKGFSEDHSIVGARLAVETTNRLGLPKDEAETVEFLVLKHLRMSYIIQRLDINDEKTIIDFAREVGSPHVLDMLFVLTCADSTAVGPDGLNDWRFGLLTQLYKRTRNHITSDSESGYVSEQLAKHRNEVLAQLEDDSDDWYLTQVEQLPPSYLFEIPPDVIAGYLSQLRSVPKEEAVVWSRYLPDRNVVEYMVGAHDEITEGVFFKLAGTFTSNGMEILSADIHTLSDTLVLDRFYVEDHDYNGEPPLGRRDEVCEKLKKALEIPVWKQPTFSRIQRRKSTMPEENRVANAVRFDHTSSEKYTIVTVFAYDQLGLLYAVSRALFEQGISIHVARIGTYFDQVVDVFYITDTNDNQITDEQQCESIRQHILQAIDEHGS